MCLYHEETWGSEGKSHRGTNQGGCQLERKRFLTHEIIFILNGLTNELYDYYIITDTTKLVWKALKKKYDIEEVESNKSAASRYPRFQMTDDRSIEV